MVNAFTDVVTTPGSTVWRKRLPLAAIFLVAFALRLLPTVVFPGLNHPDELFQSLEQAHRLVFGYGEVPWEFMVGARSWLLPGTLAAFMWLGDQLKDSPAYYLGTVYVALAALAATSTVCAFLWGQRAFGLWGGIVAAALPALWPELVYFGGRSLSECVAAPLLVLALYLIDTPPDETTGPRGFAAGLLLGISTILRLQLAPALAVILIWRTIEGRRMRRSATAVLPLLGGCLLAFGLAGLLDALTWGRPFQSLWLYFTYNTVYGIASSFGTEPWSYYLLTLVENWGWAFPALLVLIAIGGWRLPLPLTVAGIIVVTHSLVPHKEYRFIYPALLLLLLAAGIGLAQLGAVLTIRLRLSRLGGGITTVTFAALLSLGCAGSKNMAALWHGGHDVVRAASYVSGLDAVCGIGAYRTYGGYAYFHRMAPFYWDNTPRELARDLAGANILLTPESLPPGFAKLRCFGAICVGRRPGSCAPIAPAPIFEPPRLASD